MGFYLLNDAYREWVEQLTYSQYNLFLHKRYCNEIEVILAIFLFLLTLFIFVYIADEIVLEKETGFDHVILQAIAPLHSPGATSVMTFFTFFGSHYFLFPAYVVLIVALWIRKNAEDCH